MITFITTSLIIGCSQSTKPATSQEPTRTISDLADELEAQDPATPASLLFVVSVSSGAITKVDDTHHALVFNSSNLTTALAFTDRPQRHAFDLTIPMLATMWGEGENSFAADPPNAVIKDDSTIAVTELTGMSIDAEGVVTFQLDRLDYRTIDQGDDLVGVVGNVTLYIDSGASIITTAGVAGLLRTAAAGCAEVACYLWPLGG